VSLDTAFQCGSGQSIGVTGVPFKAEEMQDLFVDTLKGPQQ
jgi:hypothetical protein